MASTATKQAGLCVGVGQSIYARTATRKEKGDVRQNASGMIMHAHLLRVVLLANSSSWAFDINDRNHHT